MDARWRAWWLIPLLLGAGGQRDEPGAPGEAVVSHPGPNLCTGDLIFVGRVTATQYLEDYLGWGLPLTEAELVIENVVGGRDQRLRPGSSIKVMTIGGVAPNGVVAHWSGGPYASVGDWWFMGVRWLPPELGLEYPQPIGQILLRQAPPQVDDGDLGRVMDEVCRLHPDGVYDDQWYIPEFRQELLRVFRRVRGRDQ